MVFVKCLAKNQRTRWDVCASKFSVAGTSFKPSTIMCLFDREEKLSWSAMYLMGTQPQFSSLNRLFPRYSPRSWISSNPATQPFLSASSLQAFCIISTRLNLKHRSNLTLCKKFGKLIKIADDTKGQLMHISATTKRIDQCS